MQIFRTSQITVTTAGTPVQFSDLVMPAEQTILVKAKAANTGTISIGNTSANALSNSGVCFTLKANEAVELDGDNASNIWMDSTVSGEGVEIMLS